MRALVEALCSDRCAGRAPGTPGGLAARALVEEAFAAAGYRTERQAVPGGAANVLARLPGDVDRWVIVGAHYDHLGTMGADVYRGADDNAAAVAVLVETARALRERPPAGRGVLFAAFDAEEPPSFLGPMMGSQYFVDHPLVPIESIDMMVCMDLVGHALGPEALPADVRETVFALGAERSIGTGDHVDRLARAVPGVVVRRVDGQAVPPLSDYDAFWKRSVPFVFLSCGRSRVYHTPEDTPDLLDYDKMTALAAWLTRFTRETCARSEPRIAPRKDFRDDASTLRTVADLTRPLEAAIPSARAMRVTAESLLPRCSPEGRLPDHHRGELSGLVAVLEGGLA
jgi:Zn-dependent M28 family amino/carboxypeptidase